MPVNALNKKEHTYYCIIDSVMKSNKVLPIFLSDYYTLMQVFGIFDTEEKAKKFMPEVYFMKADLTSESDGYREFEDHEDGFGIIKVTTHFKLKSGKAYVVEIDEINHNMITIYNLRRKINRNRDGHNIMRVKYNPIGKRYNAFGGKDVGDYIYFATSKYNSKVERNAHWMARQYLQRNQTK